MKIISLLLFSFILFTAAINAKLLVVTSPNDSGPGTLRDLIATAAPGDNITFASTVTTITLVPLSPININKDLDIKGPVTIRTGGNSGIFVISSETTLGLKDLELREATNFDGAVINNGTLNVSNVRFIGNNTDNGGIGGAITNNGFASIKDSYFSDNQSDIVGGAISNSGTMSIKNSTFENNLSSAGGAIATGGVLEVKNSTFNGNTAGAGGAILIFSDETFNGTLDVKNSTFSNNVATDPDFGGGAIFNFDGTLVNKNNTFTGNSPNDITP